MTTATCQCDGTEVTVEGRALVFSYRGDAEISATFAPGQLRLMADALRAGARACSIGHRSGFDTDNAYGHLDLQHLVVRGRSLNYRTGVMLDGAGRAALADAIEAVLS